MQLQHAQRQLLFRCSLRHYSISAVSRKKSVSTPDAVAASGTSVTPRIRRPLASSFGGINIENVAIPAQSQGSRNRTNRPSDGSKSSNTPRTNQQERHRAAGEPARSAMSGWGDGLVSLSFSSRLSIRHKRKTTQNTKAHPEEAQARRQQSKPRQRPQMQGQQEQRAASHTPRSRDRQNSASAAQQARRLPSVDAKPRAASMTRPPTSRLNNHAQSKPTAPKAAPPAAKAVPASTPADRAARLTALSSISSTNLNALFRTRDTPVVAGTPLPAHASTTARVRSVLERNAGDYSRFLPRRVGVRKSASRPPALRTARHALAAQRDVSLAQRRVALHIIGGLAQPRHQVNA